MLCTDGRHTLIGAIDVFSRRARVFVSPTSRATAIAALLRRALLDWGVPETVRVDEGQDYVSRHVRRVLADLEIEPDILPPYSPERKPFIERFFGALTRGLLAYLPGFAGHDVAQRQAIRARRSFAQRRGETDADAFQVQLTAAGLQEQIDKWIETVYERQPHGGLDKRTPFEVAAAAGQQVRRIEDERALDILLMAPPSGDTRRRVVKGAVKVDGGEYFAAELAPWSGFNVEVRLDPHDRGVIYLMAGGVSPHGVSLEPGQFICRAQDAARLGDSRAAEAARAKAHMRASDRAGRQHARELKRRYRPDQVMDGALRRAGDEADRLVAFPARGKAHTTAGLDEASKAAADQGAQSAADNNFFRAYGQRVNGGRQ